MLEKIASTREGREALQHAVERGRRRANSIMQSGTDLVKIAMSFDPEIAVLLAKAVDQLPALGALSGDLSMQTESGQYLVKASGGEDLLFRVTGTKSWDGSEEAYEASMAKLSNSFLMSPEERQAIRIHLGVDPKDAPIPTGFRLHKVNPLRGLQLVTEEDLLSSTNPRMASLAAGTAQDRARAGVFYADDIETLAKKFRPKLTSAADVEAYNFLRGQGSWGPSVTDRLDRIIRGKNARRLGEGYAAASKSAPMATYQNLLGRSPTFGSRTSRAFATSAGSTMHQAGRVGRDLFRRASASPWAVPAAVVAALALSRRNNKPHVIHSGGGNGRD